MASSNNIHKHILKISKINKAYNLFHNCTFDMKVHIHYRQLLLKTRFRINQFIINCFVSQNLEKEKA
jgi:hypothetical protein